MFEGLAYKVMYKLSTAKGQAHAKKLTWTEFKDYHTVFKPEKEKLVEIIEMKIVEQKNALFTSFSSGSASIANSERNLLDDLNLTREPQQFYRQNVSPPSQNRPLS